MLARTSSRSLKKQSHSSSSSKANISRNASLNHKNHIHRIKHIVLPTPKQPMFRKTNDFYGYQKSMMSSLPKPSEKEQNVPNFNTNKNSLPFNKSNIMRKTFAVTKNGFNNKSQVSHSASKSKIMMNTTTTGFRPPTGFRRCNDEDSNNYLNRYEVVKELGKGTFGVVLLAKERQKQDKIIANIKKNEEQSKNENNPEQLGNASVVFNTVEIEEPRGSQNEKKTNQQKMFAIKVYEKFRMNKDPAKFKNIRKQINVMQNINHPNIIKLHESVDTLTKISLVVEYGGSESLLDYLKRKFPLSLQRIRSIAFQLLSAISYLHEKNIVHRDIKLQNILMYEGNIKMIDFGFSTLTHHNRKLNAICGTPNYMAPELLSKKQYIGEEADIWSYGIVMYTLGEGKHPFKAETYNELERLANRGRYQFKKITDINYKNFIQKILKVKGSDRIRTKQLLNHPFITDLS